MLRRILNAVLGSVRVKISGTYSERFLNLCSAHRISFWDVERISDEVIMATVRISGFRKLIKYSRRALCRVHIIKKTGLPFFTNKFKTRYALIIGFAASITALWWLSGYVWTVEINGCKSVSQSDIMECLRRAGFHIGMRAKDVDSDNLRNFAVADMDKLLWLNVNVNGSHAEIQVSEREEAPEMIALDEPCSIVARRDGVITDLRAKNGIAIAQNGQTVMSGDLLISGQHISELTGARTMHAMGAVKAKTWYSLSAVLPQPSSERVSNNKQKSRYSIIFGRKRINLYFGTGNRYDECDKIIKVNYIKAGDKLRLPIAFATERLNFNDIFEAEDYTEKASEILENSLTEKIEAILSLNSGMLIDKKFTVTRKGNVYFGTLEAECIEDIAKEIRLAGLAAD